MPGRYAIVEEPEALEVVDEDVYHPDQSVREINSSVRSLEPILSGPIGLKTVFYDPRWSPNQRKACLAVLITVSCFCLVILIALFVGLGKVLTYINRMEKMKQSGLYMIPDLEHYDLTSFVYASTNDKWNEEYIKAITSELNSYNVTQSDSVFEDCKPNTNASSPDKLCKFSVQSVEAGNCTPANSFGYKAGNPCLLFKFRNIKGHAWWPKIEKNPPGYVAGQPANPDLQLGNFLPIVCQMTEKMGFRQKVMTLNKDYRVFPEGFDLGFIPPRMTKDGKKKTLDPMVMVELIGLDKAGYSTADISCSISGVATNLDEFKGTRTLEFEFDNGARSANAALEDN